VLLAHNTSCRKVGLPEPDREIALTTSPIESMSSCNTFNAMYCAATNEQKQIVDEVISAVSSNDIPKSRLFYLDAPAGCGKAYVQETLRCYMKEQDRNCIAACYTGIAASLIAGGRTLHNVFKLPVPLLDTSVADIDGQSAHAEWLRKCELIIIALQRQPCSLVCIHTLHAC